MKTISERELSPELLDTLDELNKNKRGEESLLSDLL